MMGVAELVVTKMESQRVGSSRRGVLRSGAVAVATGHSTEASPHTPSAGCGNQNINSLEISEEGLVSEREFPWIVSLQDSHYTHLTFGSILSRFWILSIASAFQNRPVPLPLGPA